MDGQATNNPLEKFMEVPRFVRYKQANGSYPPYQQKFSYESIEGICQE